MIVRFLLFSLIHLSSGLKPYAPVTLPENVSFYDQVCSPCDEGEGGKLNEEAISSCMHHIDKVSDRTYKQMMEISTHGLEWIDDCKRPEAAFQQSVLLPDKTKSQLLIKFARKLNNCEDRTISIAVFGGSVTYGEICSLKVGEKGNPDPPDTDHLDLPNNLTLPVIRGDAMCPWSNQLSTLLKETFPQCKHIDVYNLAHHATDHVWLLDNIVEYFNREGGARGGKRLGDVVDLVLVDYSVNDGQRYGTSLQKLKLKPTDYNIHGRLEALTEYFIKFILKHPREPALLYIQTGATMNVFDSIKGNYDATKRFGIPVVSPRHVVSYPDNPFFLFFQSPPDKLRNRFGYYPANKSEVTENRVFKTEYSKLNVRVGDTKYDNKGKERDHKFIACWSFGVHPRHSMHTLIAQSVYYFLHVVPKGSMHMVTRKGEKKHCNLIEGVSSEYARVLRPVLNPMVACPIGPLTICDAASIVLGNKSIHSIGSNANTGWTAIEDRRNKHGFVMLESAGSNAKNTLRFNLWLSSNPQITVEFMHSYENAGKIELRLEQRQTNLEDKVVNIFKDGFSRDTITSTSSLILDSYEPTIHNALNNVFKIVPLGFSKGWVTLVVKYLELTPKELKERGGGKFKIVGVSSC